jgi:TetR/AcrR family transcriptional regulator
MSAARQLRRRLRAGSRHRPEDTRRAILEAAVAEFAAEGISGARTDAIARAAGVNKALLYYYFKDKEALHGAVLDRVFAGLRAAAEAQLDRDLPAGRKVLAYVGAHFDYIASSPLYPRLVMQEMMRAGRDGSPHIRRIVEQHFRPLFGRLAQVIQQGIAAGEFRRVDPMQFIPSMVALVVFYFSSTPVIRLMSGGDPLSRERVRARRAAVLDFVSAALFREGRRPEAAKGGRP